MRAYTCLTHDGLDMDDVVVDYDIEHPEPDVGYRGGVVVNSVWYAGKDITNRFSDRELDAIADTIILDSGDDGRGDYEYQRRKDERGMA